MAHAAIHAGHRLFIYFLQQGDLPIPSTTASDKEAEEEGTEENQVSATSIVTEWLGKQQASFHQILFSLLTHPEVGMQVGFMRMIHARSPPHASGHDTLFPLSSNVDNGR